jgi:uncharacterized membrane protein
MLFSMRLPYVNPVVIVLPLLSLYLFGWFKTLTRSVLGIVAICCLYRFLDSMGLVKVVESVTEEAGEDGRLIKNTSRIATIPIGRFKIPLWTQIQTEPVAGC